MSNFIKRWTGADKNHVVVFKKSHKNSYIVSDSLSHPVWFDDYEVAVVYYTAVCRKYERNK